LAGQWIHQDVGGLYVLVDYILLMQLAHRGRQTDGNPYKLRQLQGSLKIAIERFAAWVIDYQRRAPFIANQRQRSRSPNRVELGPEVVFMFELPESGGRRLFGHGCYY
jgi:hypothetical protein